MRAANHRLPAGLRVAAVSAALMTGAVLTSPLASASAASSAVAALVPKDIPTPPSMQAACRGGSSLARCDVASLAAINAARQQENVEPMVLPARYASFSYIAQIVVVTNSERTARGLPALIGPRGQFDLMAQQGAEQRSDPNGPSDSTWVSNLADGFRSPLQADYQWMYNDGPGGTNAGCAGPVQSSCWRHRANILSPWPGAMGAAAQPARRHQLVFTELIVKQG